MTVAPSLCLHDYNLDPWHLSLIYEHILQSCAYSIICDFPRCFPISISCRNWICFITVDTLKTMVKMVIKSHPVIWYKYNSFNPLIIYHWNSKPSYAYKLRIICMFAIVNIANETCLKTMLYCSAHKMNLR